MYDARFIPSLLLLGVLVSIVLAAREFVMFSSAWLLPSLLAPLASAVAVDLSWHAPQSTWINDLNSIISGTDVHGFIFNSSSLPRGVKYGTYNWCNMPHVRRQEYPVASKEYELQYVEIVCRSIINHHRDICSWHADPSPSQANTLRLQRLSQGVLPVVLLR